MKKNRTETVAVSLTECQWRKVRAAAQGMGETVNQFLRNVALESAEEYANCLANKKEKEAEQRVRLAKKLIVHDFAARRAIRPNDAA